RMVINAAAAPKRGAKMSIVNGNHGAKTRCPVIAQMQFSKACTLDGIEHVLSSCPLTLAFKTIVRNHRILAFLESIDVNTPCGRNRGAATNGKVLSTARFYGYVGQPLCSKEYCSETS